MYNEYGDMMKKIIGLILVFFLAGCSNKYISCDIEVENNVQNYNMTGSYKIYYKDNYVTKIEKNEKYISNDKDVISFFEESKNLEYDNLNDLYKGYTYSMKGYDTSVFVDVLIDMELVNLKQMVSDKQIDKDYVINGKLTTSGIVRFYESKGAICDI